MLDPPLVCGSPFNTPAPLNRHCNMNFKPAHTRHRLSRLVLASLTALGLAGQDLLTVLVELELADNDVGGVDGDGDGLAVGLLADDTL